MINLNQIEKVQLSAPELINREPTTSDGKTVKIEWKPVRNAASYKVYNKPFIKHLLSILKA